MRCHWETERIRNDAAFASPLLLAEAKTRLFVFLLLFKVVVMPLIFFTLSNGAMYETQAKVGQTVLQAAERAGVDGFLAECGGSCTCGTCHCHLHPSQADWFPAPDSAEAGMLDFVADERTAHSRLACQLKITSAHEGLRVGIPARQI